MSIKTHMDIGKGVKSTTYTASDNNIKLRNMR